MGAEYLFYMKSIETYARSFLALIISGIGTVKRSNQKSSVREPKYSKVPIIYTSMYASLAIHTMYCQNMGALE